MTAEQNEVIDILCIFDGKARSYYESMSEKELAAYYERYLQKGAEIE